MSIAALRWAWEQPCPSGSIKCVLMALADHADRGGECWPRISTLMRKASVPRRSVKRHLGQLIELGLIHKEQRYREDGSQTANLYLLHMHPGQPGEESTGGRAEPSTPPRPPTLGTDRPVRTSGYGSRPGQQKSAKGDRAQSPAWETQGVTLPGGECHSDTPQGQGGTWAWPQSVQGGVMMTWGGVSPWHRGVPLWPAEVSPWPEGGDTVARGEGQGSTPMNHHRNLQETTTTTTTTGETAETLPAVSPGEDDQGGGGGGSDGDGSEDGRADPPSPCPTLPQGSMPAGPCTETGIEVPSRAEPEPEPKPDDNPGAALQVGPELALPPALTPEQARRALGSLRGVPVLAQAILDELAGQIITKQAIGKPLNPLSYLGGLVSRARAGTFEPTAGIAVRQAREQAQEQARRLEVNRRRNEAAALATLEAAGRDRVASCSAPADRPRPPPPGGGDGGARAGCVAAQARVVATNPIPIPASEPRAPAASASVPVPSAASAPASAPVALPVAASGPDPALALALALAPNPTNIATPDPIPATTTTTATTTATATATATAPASAPAPYPASDPASNPDPAPASAPVLRPHPWGEQIQTLRDILKGPSRTPVSPGSGSAITNPLVP